MIEIVGNLTASARMLLDLLEQHHRPEVVLREYAGAYLDCGIDTSRVTAPRPMLRVAITAAITSLARDTTALALVAVLALADERGISPEAVLLDLVVQHAPTEDR